MDGYEAYQLFTAIKAHFNSDYDFFKYNGKLRANVSSYNNHKHRYLFEKLGKTYSKKHKLIGALVANFLHDPQRWVDDILNEYGERIYNDWSKRIAALPYYFEGEIEKLLDEAEKKGVGFGELFKASKCRGEHPPILRLLLSGRISLETFIILDKMIGFIPKLNKTLELDPVWEMESQKIENYRPFLKIDLEKYKNILKTRMKQRV